MRVEDLSNTQVEFLIARIIGHKASMQNRPFVMINDWDKVGTVVDSYRFQPITDEAQCRKIVQRDGIRVLPSDGNTSWNAWMDNLPHAVGSYYGCKTYAEAAMRCKAHSVYPDQVPLSMLEDCE